MNYDIEWSIFLDKYGDILEELYYSIDFSKIGELLTLEYFLDFCYKPYYSEKIVAFKLGNGEQLDENELEKIREHTDWFTYYYNDEIMDMHDQIEDFYRDTALDVELPEISLGMWESIICEFSQLYYNYPDDEEYNTEDDEYEDHIATRKTKKPVTE